MTEHMGCAHYPDDWKKDDNGDWVYTTTLADKYEVVTLPDGTLTIKEKDAIQSD